MELFLPLTEPEIEIVLPSLTVPIFFELFRSGLSITIAALDTPTTLIFPTDLIDEEFEEVDAVFGAEEEVLIDPVTSTYLSEAVM